MITKNVGMLLLAIYLIVVGIVTLTGLGIGIITGVLALLAGIFILIGRRCRVRQRVRDLSWNVLVKQVPVAADMAIHLDCVVRVVWIGTVPVQAA